ncbi:Hypoxia induced protein conserved region [Sphingobium faniae]|nr:Hypoxia induced protein conserved region [Sphingobium faniae]
MNSLLVIALILAMAATLFALIRGIVAFLQTSKEELNSSQGPSQSSLKQNKMMMNRILFQAAAVIIVALLLLMKGTG